MVEGMKFTNDHVERIFLEFWSGRVGDRKQFFEVVWGIKVNVRRKRLSPVCLANLDSLFCRYDDFVTSVPGGCSITCKVAESLGRLEGIGGWTPNKNESNVSENDKDANWTLLGLLFVKCYSLNLYRSMSVSHLLESTEPANWPRFDSVGLVGWTGST